MEQSRIESLVENTVNIASGFLISLLVWAYVVSTLIRWGYITIDDNVIIVSIFTVTSFARSYFWRRFFNAGLHKVIHHWVSRFFEITGW